MKKLIISILIMITLMFNNVMSYGQVNNEPTYYLNSKQFDLHKVFLNPTSIDSMAITKNHPNGEILIFTKHREFNFLTLDDVLTKYTNIGQRNNSILFRINGEIIEDTSGIKIDNTYFIYVDTKKLTGVKYLGHKFQSLIIVSIDLEKEKRKPVIYIRGNEEFLQKIEK